MMFGPTLSVNQSLVYMITGLRCLLVRIIAIIKLIED